MHHITKINNYAAIQLGLQVDIIDLAIIDFIADYAKSKQCPKKTIEGKEYFLMNWKTIPKNLPLIKIETRQGVYKRIRILKENLLVMPHHDNQINGEAWYCLGDNFYKYFTQE